jgi:hypothetical protein
VSEHKMRIPGNVMGSLVCRGLIGHSFVAGVDVGGCHLQPLRRSALSYKAHPYVLSKYICSASITVTSSKFRLPYTSKSTCIKPIIIGKPGGSADSKLERAAITCCLHLTPQSCIFPSLTQHLSTTLSVNPSLNLE